MFDSETQLRPGAGTPPEASETVHQIIAANRRRWQACAELEREITTLAGQINAMNYRFLTLLGEFDEKGGWQVDGVKSFAHWLNWKCGIGTVAAREKVRVARALPQLPGIADAFRHGEISYSKVRAMTRVATPENESLLLEYARYGTAAHIEKICGRFQRCREIDNRDADWQREPRCSTWQDEAGMVHINVVLPADEGELVIQALEKMLETARLEHQRSADTESDVSAETSIDRGDSNRSAEAENVSAETSVDTEATSADKDTSAETNVSAETSEPFNFPRGRAFSLARIAEHYLAHAGDPATLSGSDRYQVVLHVNANEQHRGHVIVGSPCCYLDQNRFLAPSVARQLACDATVTVVTEDDRGNVLNVGRRSRRISRAMRLALDIRDGGCCFPNCHQTTFTDAHHVKHWADGGDTSLDNLVTLCRHHLRLIHQGDYEIRREADEFVFSRKAPRYVLPRGVYPQFEQAPAEVILGRVPVALRTDGIVIDECTAISRWDGGPCDYGQAVAGILHRE